MYASSPAYVFRGFGDENRNLRGEKKMTSGIRNKAKDEGYIYIYIHLYIKELTCNPKCDCRVEGKTT